MKEGKESEKYARALCRIVKGIDGKSVMKIGLYDYERMIALADRYLEALEKEKEEWSQK